MTQYQYLVAVSTPKPKYRWTCDMSDAEHAADVAYHAWDVDVAIYRMDYSIYSDGEWTADTFMQNADIWSQLES